MVTAALKNRANLPAKSQIFREPSLPTGFPDIVEVEMTQATRPRSRARAQLAGFHIRLLHHLTLIRKATFKEIASDLLVSQRIIERALLDLVQAELVSLFDDLARVRPVREIFFAKRIVAIEAKVHDWRRAIAQAQANHWFASHSFILLPVSSYNDRVHDAATSAGVGVLVLDDGEVKPRVRPVKRSIPVSYGSWLFNEWALHKLGTQLLHA